MGHILYLLIFFILSLVSYFTVLYGLYIPSKSRYIPTVCKAINNTHSSALLQCKHVVFDKQMNGECFYDTLDKDMTMFSTDWFPLLVIIGTIASTIFVIIVLSIIWVRTPRTEHRVNNNSD